MGVLFVWWSVLTPDQVHRSRHSVLVSSHGRESRRCSANATLSAGRNGCDSHPQSWLCFFQHDGGSAVLVRWARVFGSSNNQWEVKVDNRLLGLFAMPKPVGFFLRLSGPLPHAAAWPFLGGRLSRNGTRLEDLENHGSTTGCCMNRSIMKIHLDLVHRSNHAEVTWILSRKFLP